MNVHILEPVTTAILISDQSQAAKFSPPLSITPLSASNITAPSSFTPVLPAESISVEFVEENLNLIEEIYADLHFIVGDWIDDLLEETSNE